LVSGRLVLVAGFIVCGLLLGDHRNKNLVWYFDCFESANRFLTPPFGFSLFYLRGVTPPEVTLLIFIAARFLLFSRKY